MVLNTEISEGTRIEDSEDRENSGDEWLRQQWSKWIVKAEEEEMVLNP